MMVEERSSRSFGERLRSAREGASLSQSQLATRSGIPKPMLSRYENDHILPSIDSLLRLVAALGLGEGALLSDAAWEASLLQHALLEHGVRITSAERADIVAQSASQVLSESDQTTG